MRAPASAGVAVEDGVAGGADDADEDGAPDVAAEVHATSATTHRPTEVRMGTPSARGRRIIAGSSIRWSGSPLGRVQLVQVTAEQLRDEFGDDEVDQVAPLVRSA